MNPIEVQIRKVKDEAIIPTKATAGSSGLDLYCAVPEMVCKGNTTLIQTGIAVAIPEGYEGHVRSRSGYSKRGLVVANGIGTIDSDYRGELGVLIHNRSGYDRIIERGERIAQLVINEIPDVVLVEVDNLDDTLRGDGGFGSTGD